MAICCIPAFITAIAFKFLPESPKFLMASGKTTEALTVIKGVYKRNTGRRFSSFPVTKRTISLVKSVVKH